MVMFSVWEVLCFVASDQALRMELSTFPARSWWFWTEENLKRLRWKGLSETPDHRVLVSNNWNDEVCQIREIWLPQCKVSIASIVSKVFHHVLSVLFKNDEQFISLQLVVYTFRCLREDSLIGWTRCLLAKAAGSCAGWVQIFSNGDAIQLSEGSASVATRSITCTDYKYKQISQDLNK